MKLLDEAAVLRGLDIEGCRTAVRRAMIALSAGETRQLPRSIIPIGAGRLFGQMPGALLSDGYFGAKLVSVFAEPDRPGRTAHLGVVVLFDAESGQAVCVADAGAITLIRTAAGTAVATDALAVPNAERLTVMGYGHQASAHIEALARVRPLREVRVWGRSIERAQAFCAAMAEKTGLAMIAVADPRAAVADAQIVCTVTGAVEPILFADWLTPGTHVNLVGASVASAAEAEAAVVSVGRYFVESRESARNGAGEFLRAVAAGLVTDDCIQAEIGEVLAGTRPGRQSDSDITVYKSIGHAVQDLAAAAYLHEQAP
ncbi:ornithine cyclodeaminase family protein [Caulobacter segnis]|jgi:ornithine cyclodeaminase|uniref:ornithine cyclodeaminase family protein n=1 Tax=Caulobacter segnis TaxID=88688 RepID=UPI001CC1182A|nr:ornithine cyclodeaminase family protein [Caulobacter segnis]UAL12612.1 ornithine cyclodeaminase family protein [Caulobacter segnis]